MYTFLTEDACTSNADGLIYSNPLAAVICGFMLLIIAIGAGLFNRDKKIVTWKLWGWIVLIPGLIGLLLILAGVFGP